MPLMMFQPLMGWSLLQLRNLLRPWVPAPLRFVKASKTIWEVDNIKRSTPPGERLLKSKLEVLRLEDLQRPGGVPLVSQNGELHVKGCEAGDPIVRILNVCFSGFPVSLGLACQGKLLIMILPCSFIAGPRAAWTRVLANAQNHFVAELVRMGHKHSRKSNAWSKWVFKRIPESCKHRHNFGNLIYEVCHTGLKPEAFCGALNAKQCES